MKKQIEWVLFKSGITMYKVSKETGVSQSTLGKYTTGLAELGNMSLDNAEKIYSYYTQVFRDLQKSNGSFDYVLWEYALTQQAYIDTDFSQGYERVVYTADVIREDGAEFKAMWLPVEGYEKMEDESDRCNWDKPINVEEV